MKLLLVAVVVIALVSVFGFGLQQDHSKHVPTPPTPKGAKVVVVAGGCFWCLDGMYRQLKGVLSVESGYAGGNRAGVSYEEVCMGNTGHAEAVRITYDPKQV